MSNVIAENIRELMKLRGVSAAQIERDTENDITQSTLSRIVNGERNPRPSTLKKIADYFEVTIAQMMGESPLPDPNTVWEYPAGRCPDGFKDDIWGEVPEYIGGITQHLLSREFPNAFYRGEVVAGNDKQAVLKILYYLWLEKLRFKDKKTKRWPSLSSANNGIGEAKTEGLAE